MFIVSFRGIAELYVILWIVYAFAMSVAYSDSGVRFVLQQRPRVRKKLRNLRIMEFSKFVANVFFFGGLLVVFGLGVLMISWWFWSIVHRGIV